MALPVHPATSASRDAQELGEPAGVKRVSSQGKQMSMLIQA